MFRFFVFVFFLFVIATELVAQILPTPNFSFISVDNEQGNEVNLKWICSDTASIDGYIIYRTFYDTPGVSDSAFMPLIEISSNSVFDWKDESFLMQNPDISEHHYAYKIASFKNINGNYNYSELSDLVAPIYFYSYSWIDCNTKIVINWKNLIGLNFSNLAIDIYTETNTAIRIDQNTFDNSYTLNVNDYNFSGNSEDIISADFRVSCYIDGVLSQSNVKGFERLAKLETNLFMDSVLLDKSQVNLRFSSSEQEALLPSDTLSLIDFYTITKFVNNQVVIKDTLENTVNSYNFDYSKLEFNPQYQIRAYNACGNELALTSKYSPLVIFADKNNIADRNIINLDFSLSENSQFEYMRLLGSDSVDNSYSEIDRKYTFETQFVDENIELAARKIYFVDLSIIDNSSSMLTYFFSNELLISKIAEVKVPNAIYLSAQNEMDRIFQIKARFVTNFSIIIFSSNGEKIFESNDFKFNWKAEFPQAAVDYTIHFYILKYKNARGLDFVKKGKFIVFY